MVNPAPTPSNQWPAWVKQRQAVHGAPVGMLMLDRMPGPGVRPFIPGDTGNATTWSVPVRYKTVPDLNVTRIFGPEGEALTSAVVEAAKELVSEGAQLITSGCGYLVRYQQAVRDAVDVPVFLSSLLLAPFLEMMLPQDKSLGILVASKTAVDQNSLLNATGLHADIGRRVVVAGLEDTQVFAPTFLWGKGDLDVSAVQKDVVDTAVALVNDRPDIGMLLMECGDLPPYAAAVQQAIGGIPVFDFTSLVEFFIGGLIRRPFTGLI
ncbi:hypothetical protein [Nocardia sp. NPDC059239]|uniref:hypothetical protein n=1 Tax=Nocardia sp. NPDC059239 TaxID=3346785 RepID=UPI00368F419A